jgi:cytochrome P460
MKFASVLLALVLGCGTCLATENSGAAASSARLSANDELLLPSNYRNWIALAPNTPGMPTHKHQHVAGKLFVEPIAYEQFIKAGAWPSNTVIVLELRSAKTATKGKYDVVGLEAAVKDDSKFPDPWTYYGIIYDRAKQDEPAIAKKVCSDCDHELDMTLAMYFPALRAVIDAKPSAMTPALF